METATMKVLKIKATPSTLMSFVENKRNEQKLNRYCMLIPQGDDEQFIYFAPMDSPIREELEMKFDVRESEPPQELLRENRHYSLEGDPTIFPMKV